jgi:hypothetical protein
LPREIEIWFTQREERFYVIAEYETSQWVQNLRAHPQAEVRIGTKKFIARSRVISSRTDPELHRAIAKLSRDKYGWGEGLIVELTSDCGNWVTSA